MSAQSMQALQYANERRAIRTHIKRQVATGRMDLIDVLDRPGPELHRALILDVLQWQNRWGAARARAVLDGVCSEFARVGDLTLRQRAAICDRIERGTAGTHWYQYGQAAEGREAAA